MCGPTCIFWANLTAFSLQAGEPEEGRGGPAREPAERRRRRALRVALATSWVNPLVAHRSNFVYASQLAQKLTYVPEGRRRRALGSGVVPFAALELLPRCGAAASGEGMLWLSLISVVYLLNIMETSSAVRRRSMLLHTYEYIHCSLIKRINRFWCGFNMLRSSISSSSMCSEDLGRLRITEFFESAKVA